MQFSNWIPKSTRAATLVALTILPGLIGCTVVVRDSGPPDHAPAWGHRQHEQSYFEYYYYPSAQVYFHIHTGYYYYYSGRRWIRTSRLPHHIRLHHRDRYKFKSRDRSPYARNKEHRRKYKSRPKLRFNDRFNLLERELNRKHHKEYRRDKDQDTRDADGYRRNGRDGSEERRRRGEEEGSRENSKKRKEHRGGKSGVTGGMMDKLRRNSREEAAEHRRKGKDYRDNGKAQESKEKKKSKGKKYKGDKKESSDKEYENGEHRSREDDEDGEDNRRRYDRAR